MDLRCPIDGATLIVAVKSGVEIDYCPKCRGVWLERGELDKILEKSASLDPQPRSSQHERSTRDYSDEDRHDSYSHDDRGHYADDKHYAQKKKRERGGFLEDIFGGFGD